MCRLLKGAALRPQRGVISTLNTLDTLIVAKSSAAEMPVSMIHCRYTPRCMPNKFSARLAAISNNLRAWGIYGGMQPARYMCPPGMHKSYFAPQISAEKIRDRMLKKDSLGNEFLK
jgi:hypothetical protein